MKIVITHTDFRIYWPARIKGLAQQLACSGDSLYIIEIAGKGTLYSFSEERQDGANYYCLFPEERMEDIAPEKAGRLLYEKLEELNPDAVIAGPIAFPAGAAAVRWTRKRKKGIVIFDDARLKDLGRSAFVNFIKRRVYRNVDAVLCPSSHWDETFRFFGFDKSQLFYGLDAVDNDFWRRDPVDKPALPSPFLLGVGRQAEGKNFLLLIKAFAQYKKMHAGPLSLVLVGEGIERPLLEDYVRENKIRDVHFYPFLSQEKLRAFYKSAELFVFPSLKESWGLVVNEAMASGLPVVAGDNVGCVTTLIDHGVNGYIFPSGNLSVLVNVLKDFFLLSDDDRLKMRDAALNKISHWGIPRFAAGAREAVLFARNHKKKRLFIDSVILNLWHGRYNP